MLIVFSTISDNAAAQALANKVVRNKLAACVQIVPGITSVYEWKDEINVDGEVLMLFKTEESKFDELSRYLESEHPYDVPEIAAVDSNNVNKSYSAWLSAVLS